MNAIRVLVDRVGLTRAGASTYYHRYERGVSESGVTELVTVCRCAAHGGNSFPEDFPRSRSPVDFR
jgi:hypothetical protein